MGVGPRISWLSGTLKEFCLKHHVKGLNGTLTFWHFLCDFNQNLRSTDGITLILNLERHLRTCRGAFAHVS